MRFRQCMVDMAYTAFGPLTESVREFNGKTLRLSGYRGVQSLAGLKPVCRFFEVNFMSYSIWTCDKCCKEFVVDNDDMVVHGRCCGHEWKGDWHLQSVIPSGSAYVKEDWDG